MTTSVLTDASVVTDERSAVSWGAVIGGAVVACATTLFLLAFGVGVGLSTISPWSNEGVSATTFKVGAGLYLVAMAMLSSAVGGYLTGRLRATWATVHEHEVYFRDTAHGLLTWALATALGFTLLGAAGTHILAGASAGSIPAAAAGASSAANPVDPYVDSLLRVDPAPATPGAGAAPSPAGGSDVQSTRAELGRLLAPALQKGGDLSPADRTYIAKVVSARTGLSQADAEKRVSDTIAQAKKTADDTRKATAKLMLWLAASLLAGALAAMLGAVEGGMLRDSKWYEPGWRTTRTH